MEFISKKIIIDKNHMIINFLLIKKWQMKIILILRMMKMEERYDLFI
jgi:hypothetical protein